MLVKLSAVWFAWRPTEIRANKSAILRAANAKLFVNFAKCILNYINFKPECDGKCTKLVYSAVF